MFAEPKVVFYFVFIYGIQNTLTVSSQHEITAWSATLKDHGAHILPEKKYIKRPNGIGPLPTEILNANPRLEFIGSINSKSFYAEKTAKTWAAAAEFCDNLGMELGRFDSNNEKDYVYQHIDNSYGEVWIGASLDFQYYRYQFYWEDNGTPLPLGWWWSFGNAASTCSLVVDSGNAFPNTYMTRRRAELLNVLCYI